MQRAKTLDTLGADPGFAAITVHDGIEHHIKLHASERLARIGSRRGPHCPAGPS